MTAFALILAVVGGALMATAVSDQNSSNAKTVGSLFQECGGASGNILVAACTTASECTTNKASCNWGTTGYLKCTDNTCDCYKVCPDLFASLNSNATESEKNAGKWLGGMALVAIGIIMMGIFSCGIAPCCCFAKNMPDGYPAPVAQAQVATAVAGGKV